MKRSLTLTPSISRVSSPLGDMLLACTPLGLCGLWFKHQAHFPLNARLWTPVGPHHPERSLHDRGQSWVDDYFAKRPPATPLPLDWCAWGTVFEHQVWRALLDIPWGQTVSYGELARHLGRPLAARAVGSAVGKNPWALVVPCHRVGGSNGSLTGYAAGVDKKTYLWEMEAISQAQSHA
jgi:methylated-DNA-[protein]-cysteine S-methyltransferase